MRVLLDTNVILDVALKREPFVAASSATLRKCEADGIEKFVAWHSLSNLFYILGKDRGAGSAIEFLEWLVTIARVPTVGHPDAVEALRFGMTDFEDALQLSAAIACGASVLITRNAADFKNSPVTVRTPEQFLAS